MGYKNRWKQLLAALAPGMFRRSVETAVRPAQLLELFSYEACPASRRVRRLLTELDLDFIHRSCPRGESPNRRRLEERGGRVRVPYLVDPNTGVEMYESRDIAEYLLRTYGESATCSRSRPTSAPL